jgi:hypothetical protein
LEGAIDVGRDGIGAAGAWLVMPCVGMAWGLLV